MAMRIAVAGKGGVGKTTLTALLGDYLARQGRDVMLIDADTALSLGSACGLAEEAQPVALADREDLVRERIGDGAYLSLNPRVDDLPGEVCVPLPVCRGPYAGGRPGKKRLLVMGGVAGGGSGCACAAGHLLQAVIAQVLADRDSFVLVDCEAGVEHLGRGTVRDMDALVVVSEASRRSLDVAGRVSAMARQLGLAKQMLAVTRCQASELSDMSLPAGVPVVAVPAFPGLTARQTRDGSVLSLPETALADAACAALLAALASA